MIDERTSPPHRIVCALDLGPASHEVVRVASEIARERSADLALVHAVDAGSRESIDRADGFDVTDEVLATYAAEARRLGVRAVTSTVTTGGAAGAVVHAARAEPPADLVVVGSHGRRGLTRVLLGSVAELVVRRAPCSVLVVREPGA